MAVEFNKTWLQGREERRFTTRGEDKEAGIRSCSECFSHLGLELCCPLLTNSVFLSHSSLARASFCAE